MNDFQQTLPAGMAGYPQQLAPQGLIGGLLGGPLGGMIGRGIGGIFGNPNLGSQIGQMAGGIGGSILPFSVDPMMAAYMQQQQQQQPMQSQLAPQGFFGNLLGQVGQPLGGAIGGLFGQAGLGNTIGGMAGQLGRMLPFSADPMMAAYMQQQQQQQQQPMQSQLAPQGFFGNLLGQVGQPLGSAIGGIWGQSGLGGQIGQAAGQLGRMLPFNMDPMMMAYMQQQQQQQPMQSQLAPQGFFGNLLGQVGQPLGGAIGGLFGQAGLGNTIGGMAGQLGRMLPFNMDPMMMAYMQQQAGAYPGYQPNPGAQMGGMPNSGYGGAPQTLH